jgi:CDP-diacylglycerol--glycerol-3-phosphate 3-phosphatidyltransferase
MKLNLPNWITLSRSLSVPIILYLLNDPHPTERHRWVALIIFLLAALTDWIDGYLARRLDQITELGKFLDPLVDKVLVLGTLLALIQIQMIPAWGVCIILIRELTVAGWRVNPSLTGSSKVIGANLWGKSKTVTQIIAIGLLLTPLSPHWNNISLAIFWLSVVLTCVSGIIYLLPSQTQSNS